MERLKIWAFLLRAPVPPCEPTILTLVALLLFVNNRETQEKIKEFGNFYEDSEFRKHTEITGYA